MANVPKKGASLKLAAKLKALGQQPPPSGLVDAINKVPGVSVNGNLDEIKIGRVYTHGGQFFRTVGWLGQNSIVFEQVTVYSDMRGFHEFFRARRVKGRRVYQETLTKFSEKYRIPTKAELQKVSYDEE